MESRKLRRTQSSIDLRRDFERAGLELSEVLKTGRELGNGAYGMVFEVALHGTHFAAKAIHSVLKSGEKIQKDFFSECVHCSRLRHPNIVQLIGVHYPSPTDKLPWLVMELMKGSLSGLIERCSKEGKDIPFYYKRSILVDIGQGLQFLHSKKIIHRDLSSNNVLLTKNYVAKIGDLGVAKVVDPQNTQRLTWAPGTQAFMPPEALLPTDLEYDTSLDMFSLGCVCIHLVSLEWPMPEAWSRLDKITGKMILVSEIQRRGKFLVKFDQLPAELKILVEECLNRPEYRPFAGDFVERLRNIKHDPLPHENDDLLQLHTSLIDCEKSLNEKEDELAQCAREKDEELAKKDEDLPAKIKELAIKDEDFNEESARFAQQLAEKDQQLVEKDQQLQNIENMLVRVIQRVTEKDQQLADRNQQLKEKDRQIAEMNQQLTKQTSMLLENQRKKVFSYLAIRPTQSWG